MMGRFTTVDEDNARQNFVFGAEKLNRDIDGIELLKKAEKIDEEVNLAAEKVLDDKALKKIKILQLKEGVRKVDRHGFRDDDEDMEAKIKEDSVKNAIKDEYYHKMLELIRRKREMDQEMDYDGDEEMGEDEMEEEEAEEES